MDTWNCITRADDKSKTISVNAKHLLGFLFDKLQKDDCIIINHDWISKVTGCKRRQNINLIKQLEDIFTFTYRTQITVMDQNKKKRVLRYIYIKNT
jgi:hypothetical protein